MTDLVRDLLDPAAYPEPRPEAVELRATHGSWVFLAGERVYKVKRPVDYGFMDYSTPERRRHFCEEELRVNRRLAPSVYLDVVPIRRDRSTHAFVGSGEVVDHAVVMARLPDDATLLAQLRRGELGAPDLDLVAARLAGFHRAADRAAQAPGVFASNVAANFSGLLPYSGTFLDERRLLEVDRHQRHAMAAAADRLQARIRHGHVRDGHGDLRLEHVYLIGGEPLVLDAIEFNASFREGDAALDLAFLAMDLDHELRPDLSDWLVARYASSANDFDLYPLLDLYKGYRAVVRAKVACFVAADPAVAPEKRQRKIEEATTFLELAASYATAEAGTGAVVAVGGLVGAGKSSIADRLSLELRLPVVASDPTRKHLAGIAPTERGGEAIYGTDFSERTFDELFRRAGSVLQSGRGVLLDATFARRDLRERARRLAAEHGRRFLFVEVVCDEQVVRERLRERSRGPSVSDAGEDLYDRLRAGWEAVTELPGAEHLVHDTGGVPRDVATEVRRRLAG